MKREERPTDGPTIGGTAAAEMSEEALDQVIDDSFPASDAPSHTPTIALGGPRGGESDPEARGRPIRALAIAAGAAMSVLIIAGLVGSALWRHRTHGSKNRGKRWESLRSSYSG